MTLHKCNEDKKYWKIPIQIIWKGGKKSKAQLPTDGARE
jgi:hypothetical protein